MKTQRAFLALSLLAVAMLAASPASAQIEPSAAVLVPYFAVDLAHPVDGDGTLFAVCNHGSEPVEARFTLFTNWGIPLLEIPLTMHGTFGTIWNPWNPGNVTCPPGGRWL